MKGRALLPLLFCLPLLMCAGPSAAKADPLRVRVDFGKAGEAIVHLDDNDAARNFYAMLPLKLSFEDFNSTEKIATLPQKLSLGSSPTSCDPEKGSFTYYIPWGNIAVFYRDFRPSRNLVPLGSVVRGMDLFAGQKGDFSVRIERTE